MANDVRMFDMLISCPGDVETAVDIIKDVIENFNQQFNDTLGIGIRPRYWKKSGFSQSGGKPQELLNKQFVEKCDLAVAVFKARFGTPTDRYGSGSEEEIEIMLQAGKQVFMFFDETPMDHATIDLEQLQKVRAFKEKYTDKGIFWSYKSLDSFREIFNAHITRYFLTFQQVEEIRGNFNSDLVVKSYFQKRIFENAILSKFDMGSFTGSDRIVEEIKKLFERILKYRIDYRGYNYTQLLEKKVEIPESVVAWIDAAAEKFGYDTTGDFYNIGDLRESTLSSSVLFGGKDLKGTDDEKAKYRDIIKLKENIEKLIGHIQVENFYSDLIGIQFVVCNNGTQYDEDIDIELRIPRKLVLLHQDLSVPDKPLDLDEFCFADIFEIQDSKDFVSYTSTLQKMSYMQQSTQFSHFSGKSYEEEYREALDEVFNYTIFEDGEVLIIKVHMDYLKQHNNAAFPTWIFLNKSEEYPDIEYTIISKNRPDIIKKSLKVESRICDSEIS